MYKLGWQILFFSLTVFVASFAARRFVESILPSVRKDTPMSRAQRVWEKTILPTLPIALGGALALVVPDMVLPDISSVRAQVAFGAVCGFFCSWAYKIAKAILQGVLKKPLPYLTGKEGDSMGPAATSDRPPAPVVIAPLPASPVFQVPETGKPTIVEPDDSGAR